MIFVRRVFIAEFHRILAGRSSKFQLVFCLAFPSLVGIISTFLYRYLSDGNYTSIGVSLSVGNGSYVSIFLVSVLWAFVVPKESDGINRIAISMLYRSRFVYLGRVAARAALAAVISMLSGLFVLLSALLILGSFVLSQGLRCLVFAVFCSGLIGLFCAVVGEFCRSSVISTAICLGIFLVVPALKDAQQSLSAEGLVRVAGFVYNLSPFRLAEYVSSVGSGTDSIGVALASFAVTFSWSLFLCFSGYFFCSRTDRVQKRAI